MSINIEKVIECLCIEIDRKQAQLEFWRELALLPTWAQNVELEQYIGFRELIKAREVYACAECGTVFDKQDNILTSKYLAFIESHGYCKNCGE